MFSLYELAKQMDKDLEEIHREGNPELAEIITALADDIREDVRRSGLRGKKAEERFYQLFNAAIDPFQKQPHPLVVRTSTPPAA